MAEEARLAVKGVRVNHRPADLYVYDECLVVTTEHGERRIPMGQLDRIATRRAWGRGARLLIALRDGELVEVRRLSVSATVTAHRTIVAIARGFH